MYFSSGYGTYMLFALPALLLGMWAQYKVKNAYEKFARVPMRNGMTGAEIARHILDNKGLQDVRVEETSGMLTDHYDPRSRILKLSSGVFRSNSVSAAGVAAHEAGHAIQHKEKYGPLNLRSIMVPSVQMGSWLGPILFFIGIFMSSDTLALAGLLFFAATAIFALVTVPVELDASKRAKAILASSGLAYSTEVTGVDQVLDAAALTYVAGAAQVISTLLYYVFILMGNRRRG